MIINSVRQGKHILSFVSQRAGRLILPILGLMFLFGCNDKQFTIGDNFLESQTHLIQIDTLQIKMSTVVLDSLPTSATNVALAGSYKDEQGGNITCNSFFQIGTPAVKPFNSDFTYDSITLSLKCTGYYLGDTTQNMDLSVYKTTELIKPFDDGLLYSNTQVGYGPSPIGSKQFQTYPNYIKEVQIRLNDEVGNDLFDRLLEAKPVPDIFESDGAFQDYFSDLALISNPAASSPIIGFSATTSDLKLKLYAHKVYNGINVQDTCFFPLSTTSTQFNQIVRDFPDAAIANHTLSRYDIPSEKTGGKTYLEGGVGLLTKIKFTGIPNLLLNQNGTILKAELILKPDVNTYNWQPLPTKIQLYEVFADNHFDNYNLFSNYNLLYNPDNTVLYGTYVPDILYHENASYTFDITNFILGEAADKYFDPEHGLLVSLPRQQLLTTFNRLVISAKHGGTYLRVYYLNYK